MKLTKKQQKEIQNIEKKVSNVCDNNDGVVDEITGITYPKKSIKVGLNEDGINKENDKPQLPELQPELSKNKGRDITISLSFGKSSPPLKQQIKNQGFKISNKFIENAEEIICDLHCLCKVGILKEKELMKCFKRLNKRICKIIINSELKDGEVAQLKEIRVV